MEIKKALIRTTRKAKIVPILVHLLDTRTPFEIITEEVPLSNMINIYAKTSRKLSWATFEKRMDVLRETAHVFVCGYESGHEDGFQEAHDDAEAKYNPLGFKQ